MNPAVVIAAIVVQTVLVLAVLWLARTAFVQRNAAIALADERLRLLANAETDAAALRAHLRALQRQP